MSDDAAQRRSDVCDKSGKSDKRTQSHEQEICEELASREFEKEEQKEERKETEEERERRTEGGKAESEKFEKDDGGDKKDEAEEVRRTRRSVRRKRGPQRTSGRTTWIFVGVDGCKVRPLAMSLNDKSRRRRETDPEQRAL